MLFWALNESPVLLECLDRCLQFYKQRKRGLVVVNSPWLQK
jgi:hypothetical protein